MSSKPEPKPRRRDHVFGQPLMIIEIIKDADNQTEYRLHRDRLESILEPIRDKQVAVFSATGPSRQGKSFLLSYMIKFLNDPENIDWIGNNDKSQPLKGFKWGNDFDPVTDGILMWSKPFILQQTGGKQIAVVLMDTQGVFDDYLSHKDWSTIVGISLLTSSCIIFNFFTNLNENMLQVLHSFLEYGLAVKNAGGEDNDEHPFQKLVLLIRDWNMPKDCAYGQTGGEKFLKKRLEIKDYQPETSKQSRKLLTQCFSEIFCYLMPPPGEKAKDTNYNGCLAGMDKTFANKLQEFISILLNPEEIAVKTIGGNNLTAGDLIQYFVTYIEILNREELNTFDLIEATAKATGHVAVKNSKEIYVSEMKKKFVSAPYLSQEALNRHHSIVYKKAMAKFKGIQIRGNEAIKEEFTQFIETELKIMHKQFIDDNNNRRDKAANEIVEESTQMYVKSMEDELEDTFVDDCDFVEISI